MDSWPAADVPELPGRAPVTRVWDSASAALAVAATGQHARLYACGITPYDATHVGHAATYTAWDLLIRAWRDAGHQVSYVQNVTDVDDPLLERASRDGEDWQELAAREIALYRSDMTALRVLPPDHLVGAVEALPLIERFNQLLADRGSVYDLESDVYFSRFADPAFGSVSGLDPDTMAELSAERGGDPGRQGKKDPLDPVVWMAERPSEPSWPSEFGPGRPGWHVECAAIATHYLGDSFDVQAGGRDLVFPHHEMSASHARVALGEHAFARAYAHAGMVRLDGEKMSKSRGNLVFVSRLLADGHDPMAIRLALLAHHYRRDWDWTNAALAAATERLTLWRRAAETAGGSTAVDARGGSARGGSNRGGSNRGGSARGGSARGGSNRGGSNGGWSNSVGEDVLVAIRDRIASDLDAPGALQIVDSWAARAMVGAAPGSGPLIRAALDAVLGIAL
jgi:L-cysteine:1D-myo-inositol 2-amino-2-deoxy-alpha-D-glucopyranoside ligase